MSGMAAWLCNVSIQMSMLFIDCPSACMWQLRRAETGSSPAGICAAAAVVLAAAAALSTDGSTPCTGPSSPSQQWWVSVTCSIVQIEPQIEASSICLLICDSNIASTIALQFKDSPAEKLCRAHNLQE
jgi:hypothetical protein